MRTGGLMGNVAGELGRGLAAGLMGTLAITVAATLDQRLRNRKKAGSGEAPPSRSLFEELIEPWLFSADAVGKVLGGVLGAEMLVMPKAGFFPPVGEWGREAVIASSYQHALYAITAGLTFDLLEG